MRMVAATTLFDLEVCYYLGPFPLLFAPVVFDSAYTDCLKEYLAPNDEAELDRLDMHHHLAALLIDGKLHVAPIGENPQAILDVGCGTGIWAIDIGESLCRVTLTI